MKRLSNWSPRAVAPSTWILTACQALYFGGVSVDLTLTALMGLMLAPSPFLATAPLAAISISGTVCSFAAGVLAGKWGYPAVMIAGATVAVIGGIVSAVAIATGSFALLCFGTALVGAYRSTGGYIRYMAADLVPDGSRDRALSFILYGGLVAAFLGPFAATGTADLVHPKYSGAYLLVAVLAAGNIVLISALRFFKPSPTLQHLQAKVAENEGPIPIAVARRNPNFLLGLIALGGAGVMMTMVMAMGPLANQMAGNSMTDGASIIQWHLVGMFAPALISGAIMTRFGARKAGVAGAALLALGAIIGATGAGFGQLLASLALNGVGWNFLYLAGSSLIVSTYPGGRGAKVQSVAEGTAAVTGVVASLLSSTVFELVGWQAANLPVLMLAVLIVMLLLVVRARHKVDDLSADADIAGSETSALVPD